MKKFLFCQFSNKLLNPKNDSLSDRYYNALYEHKEQDGYYRDNNFFELPLWIAETCGCLTGNFRKELYIITDIKQAIKDIREKYADYVLFSVLDVNKEYVAEIARHYLGKAKVCVGGYIDFSYFHNKNIHIFNGIKDFIEYLGLKYEYNLDYSLFSAYKTIPRLTLSKGCLNRCKFCTVEKTVTAVSELDILKQIESFRVLRFRLIYLNDKTFGQAQNFTMLYDLYNIVKEYNPDFLGFIIQTTCMNILDNSIQELLEKGIIYAVEIGIETFNDNLLYALSKPQTEQTIIDAIETLKKYQVRIIPNIIIGILNENEYTYDKTLNFLRHYQKDIYLLNIYNLAVYENTELSQEIIKNSDSDINENITDKSFYSKSQKIANEKFYNEIFKLAMEIL
jgi:radical SAM superfamily enzyme